MSTDHAAADDGEIKLSLSASIVKCVLSSAQPPHSIQEESDLSRDSIRVEFWSVPVYEIKMNRGGDVGHMSVACNVTIGFDIHLHRQ